MLHSFVAAKLLPRLPVWASYGQRVATSLVTTPFLALHLYETASDPLAAQAFPNLFIISREKPDLPGNQYFALNQSKAEAQAEILTVVPPLPFRHPLYLSVTPRIRGDFSYSETYELLGKMGTYQLEQSSLDRLMAAIAEAGPSIPGIRETGGDDEPAPDWDTLSGESPREAPGVLEMRRYVPLSFDLVSFSELSDNFDMSVLKETALYRQLYLDYTWEGCGSIMAYIKTMREALPPLIASGRVLRYPSMLENPDRVCDPGVESLRPSVHHLLSIPIPHDGDPASNVSEEDEIADDFKEDDPMSVVALEIAIAVPAIPAKEVTVIALDCNALIDTDRPLQEALVAIFPPSTHHFTAEELLYLYVEYEALLRAEGLEGPALVIQRVARYLGITVTESKIQASLHLIEETRIYEDVPSVISSLVDSGYMIFALPGLRSREIVEKIPGISFAFCDACADESSLTWSEVLDFVRWSRPSVSANQILVATSNLQGFAEPAGRAGHPTAFIKPPGTRSANLCLPNVSPTYSLSSWGDLITALQDPDSVPPAPVPNLRPPYTPDSPPFRIHGCYQLTYWIGSGSYAFVWGGVQMDTGAEVAVKFEPIHPDVRESLPYESAIYAQLEGVTGIPRIHWSGPEHGAYVLVMDKLGPNVEELRRFCRGALSLRTVLMLGEQMLTIIEEVHARGIIVRDIKPENFAMGLVEEYKCLHLLDLGLGKLYLDPTTGKHMPFREGRGGIGTPRYASHNVHFGLEPSRRDDVEAIGILLLYLCHGRLPWQGIVVPDIPSKLLRIGEMKRGKPFADLLTKSPAFFDPFFKHCRSLDFDTQPDYAYLRNLLRRTMKDHGWEYDWEYDWWSPGERGTLLPNEYKLDMGLVQPVRHRQDVL